ncbi:MAG TPA: ABC transporter permease [Micromonosporaceae bacterium]|nr:ABC transporter permease [Micromonosporaceae bacterium]
MVTTLLLPRLAARSAGFTATGRRAASVIERNVVATKVEYVLVMVSGLFEPVLFLLSIGVGVGTLVGDITLPDGRAVPYAAFVAPAMLAASAMNGALAETTYNFFAKIKYYKLYDAMLATPIRPVEIAFGELCWAMLRGSVYSAAFLALMVLMDVTTVPRAVAMFPATVLVGFVFGALGMAVSTFFRSWQDFDVVASAQFALFLFSGTFAPPEAYPAALRWLVEISPLYQAIVLIRGISLGVVGWAQAAAAVYLLVLLVAGLVIAARRMERLLYR